MKLDDVGLRIVVSSSLDFAARALLGTAAATPRPRIDVPGTVTAFLGLFALVFGFSRAETHGWGAPTTLAFLAAGVVLLAAFAAIQRRVRQPVLPLRIVLDRNRGGSFLAVGIVGVGMFGAFFFLTFYLQQTRGYSPVRTGFAFLPLVGAIMATSPLASSVLLRRAGPRPLVSAGLVLAGVGTAVLAQLGVDSSYAGHVLPGLVMIGLGLGLAIAPAFSTATLGVAAPEAGVASATVNTMQQIGGSLGTALLSTQSASATSGYLAGRRPTPGVVAQATVHGYTVAFWCAAAVFAAGAVVCGLLQRGGAPLAEPGGSPACAA